MATMDSLLAEITDLRKEIKSLAKIVRKVRAHQEDPTGEKVKARTENSGFNRPQPVSDKLRTFLGLADGEMISRSQVTRKVNQYIKEHDLKHPDNGRIIVMDDKLKTLLDPPEGVQVTFLTMQKYISPHYIKDEPVEAEKPSTAPASTSEEAPAKKVVKRPVVKKPVAKA
jgi:chromatin remodeling complex protein RSC6